MGNRAVKYRDGDETLPSAPEQTNCGEYSEQCQHTQTCSCNVFAVLLVQEPTGAASQLLVPNKTYSAPGSLTFMSERDGKLSFSPRQVAVLLF